MQRPVFKPSRSMIVVAVVALIALLAAVSWLRPNPSPEEIASPAGRPVAEIAPATAAAPAGPPWRYGRTDARYTVIEYADLECPYCRAYFAVLKRWIDTHPEVGLQWHHLPLPMHEPAASKDARLVECVGEAGGHRAFWQAVEWVYTHTRGDGQGLPEGLRYPDLAPAAQQCLDSDRPDVVIRAQSVAAAQANIKATPTLRLQDREAGKTLLLHGPVEGDALLSAIDLLAAGGTGEPPSKEMPAESIGDMPR
ncbi:MAG: thioredoxin domain-containing protein [Burkholderiales bacterium]|nr:thioredoxin domain-containing protein [Burkholderiales bacterium]OJX04253.1 MAG: disulfide bond formation protein DsbA [Burkholderiales bacterium 70-64]